MDGTGKSVSPKSSCGDGILFVYVVNSRVKGLGQHLWVVFLVVVRLGLKTNLFLTKRLSTSRVSLISCRGKDNH